MSQEWPGSLVGGVFRKTYKLLRSYVVHIMGSHIISTLKAHDL